MVLEFDDWPGKTVTFKLGSAKLGSNQGSFILVEVHDVREPGSLPGTDNCPVSGLEK